MAHVTCRLTAKNRDQLRNPTLGNGVWATFTFTFYATLCYKEICVSPKNVESLRRAGPLILALYHLYVTKLLLYYA